MPAATVQKPAPTPDYQVISVITDPNRWQILESLTEQMSPADIATRTGMKPANVQYHLKILVQAGVVVEEPHPEYERRLLYRRRNLVAQVTVEETGMQAQVFLE